uniref:PDIL2-3 n=1 Tax=Arundo donax TaxID=35708 RepID=A0A0A9EDN9_ARUDO
MNSSSKARTFGLWNSLHHGVGTARNWHLNGKRLQRT